MGLSNHHEFLEDSNESLKEAIRYVQNNSDVDGEFTDGNFYVAYQSEFGQPETKERNYSRRNCDGEAPGEEKIELIREFHFLKYNEDSEEFSIEANAMYFPEARRLTCDEKALSTDEETLEQYEKVVELPYRLQDDLFETN